MLREIVLGLIVLAWMGYGMYLMFRIDGWAAKEEKLKEEASPRCIPKAILFGERSRLEPVGAWLKEQGVQPVYLEEIAINGSWDGVKYTVAMSSSDADNLSICNLMRKLYQVEHLYGICNEAVNEAVYRRFHIQTLKKEEEVQKQLHMESEADIA